MAGNGRKEDRSGEEDSDGDLFGKAMGAAGDVDEDEISEEQAPENEIKMDSRG